MKASYRMCTRCVMDTTDSDIQFNQDGVCNHCRRYDEVAKERLFLDEAGQEKLKTLVDEIKTKGKNKKYDCIIGVSGGVDSTYAAYITKQLGLRPLAVHLDNGWDSELAVSNIKQALTALDIDLYTHGLDWEEFRDLQLSFLKASVPDIEVPTDHTISACLYETAVKEGVKYIISGGNVSTEAITPVKWAYGHRDWKYMKSIHRRFGKIKLKNFAHYNLITLLYYIFIKRIKVICILNFLTYVKKDAMAILEKEFNWRPYSGKHHESVITRFLQTYILPRKFNIDKGKAHLSTLICSGQITREEALEELKDGSYISETAINEEKEYVSSKFGLREEEFEEIMSLPIKSFKDYPSNFWAYQITHKRGSVVRKLKFP